MIELEEMDFDPTEGRTCRLECERQGVWSTYGGSTRVYERMSYVIGQVRLEIAKRLFRLPFRLVDDTLSGDE